MSVTSAQSVLKLGLIGDKIAASQAPRLHHLAGAQNGQGVRYDRLVPAENGLGFAQLFEQCRARGYRGLNITYPYKEQAAALVQIEDPLVKAMGAVNTVLFDEGQTRGFNTDYTGFVAGYRNQFDQRLPGVCCLVGTGGVGRALAFALVQLGASALRLVDRDQARAEALAAQLATLRNAPKVTVFNDVRPAATGAQGVLNGTPLGMYGAQESAVAADILQGIAAQGGGWVFDAVYTPENTRFVTEARAAGLEVLSGYELFFYQGVHAWSHFSGLPLDADRLRAALSQPEDCI